MRLRFLFNITNNTVASIEKRLLSEPRDGVLRGGGTHVSVHNKYFTEDIYVCIVDSSDARISVILDLPFAQSEDASIAQVTRYQHSVEDASIGQCNGNFTY